MKYPSTCKNVIDVTKAPYFADNTGKTDVTAILCRVYDDVLRGYIEGIEETKKALLALHEKQGGNVYIGIEAARMVNGEMFISFVKDQPQPKFIYFPKGTYLVSDTIVYSFENLNVRQQWGYNAELCRHIHIMGEDCENTVIKLRDYSEGFGIGANKPVISFNRAAKDEGIESTNVAMLNSLEDITVDCGEGNDGSIGVLYASSNVGRIENVKIRTRSGIYGIKFDWGSEGCVESVSIEGFDYGIKAGLTSPLVFDKLDLSGNKIAGVKTGFSKLIFNKTNWGSIPAFDFEKSIIGSYLVEDDDVSYIGDVSGNRIFTNKKPALPAGKTWPKPNRAIPFENWVCVDDFGAVGDGKTDCTIAVQKALDSGKEVVYFGEGTYFISRTLKIPKTVKILDFLYCDIKPGHSLIVGEMSGMFDICEESEDFFFAQHFGPQEWFGGYFRMFRHTAKRPAVIKDVLIFASLYFNTANDNEVYFDNVFTNTNHYAQNVLIGRDGYTPVFCRVLPVELHNQQAYGRNLNIERGEVELFNDNSTLVVDGYKVEGPGELLKSVNGGQTHINLATAAWWGNTLPDNVIFDMTDSHLTLVGGSIFKFNYEKALRVAVSIKKDGAVINTDLLDCSVVIDGERCYMPYLSVSEDRITLKE